MTFQEFFDYRKEKPENIGRSFTYGACLYDYILQGFEDSELDYMILETIGNKLKIEDNDILQSLYSTKSNLQSMGFEILDVSELDEIARVLYCEDGEDENID